MSQINDKISEKKINNSSKTNIFAYLLKLKCRFIKKRFLLFAT